MRIDHIGVATEDLEEVADLYDRLLDTPVVHEEKFDGLRIAFLEMDATYFELLEPTTDGTVARFLENNGPGIHHVGIETADIEAALNTAQDAGIELIDATPRPGAWGHSVAFLHPASTGGVLIEFVEH